MLKLLDLAKRSVFPFVPHMKGSEDLDQDTKEIFMESQQHTKKQFVLVLVVEDQQKLKGLRRA